MGRKRPSCIVFIAREESYGSYNSETNVTWEHEEMKRCSSYN